MLFFKSLSKIGVSREQHSQESTNPIKLTNSDYGWKFKTAGSFS